MRGTLLFMWENGLLDAADLKTTEREKIEIIARGDCSAIKDTATNAIVKIGDTTWSGNVMFHNNDNAEPNTQEVGNTILHIAEKKSNATHNNAPWAVIEIPQELKDEIDATARHSHKFPCGPAIAALPAAELHQTLAELFTERLKEKEKLIERIFLQCDRKWDDTLLKTAIRSFGFGIQSPVFDEWATLLNTNALGKHRDNKTQVEAILYGQAGLLQDESIPYYYREEAAKSEYYNELNREFRFLQNKFGLQVLEHTKWGNGAATPHQRIARIANLYCNGLFTMSGISSAGTLTNMYKLFSAPLDGYWQNHICFGSTETAGAQPMKQKQVDVIIINSIIPMLHIYGTHRQEPELCKIAQELLQQIESEENSITKQWRAQGVKPRNAADSQALLQLNRAHCRINGCASCPMARHYVAAALNGTK
ncbi:MAG: DUF2851 family protein [Bacteroidaceae bacterium]|nr:DUF2851 family protein [Bacteroidaceae bacterium]